MKEHHKTLFIILTVLVALLLAGWFLLQSSLSPFGGDAEGMEVNSYIVWEQGERCFSLEVANTPQLRRQGLSGREDIARDEGMIFLYQFSGEYGFWMKDMNFPIDMIWLNDEDEIITIRSSVSPDTYPTVFYPTESARKIIEVTAGEAEALNLKVGDLLDLSNPTSTPAVDCAML